MPDWIGSEAGMQPIMWTEYCQANETFWASQGLKCEIMQAFRNTLMNQLSIFLELFLYPMTSCSFRLSLGILVDLLIKKCNYSKREANIEKIVKLFPMQ